ncbi:MAG TPA: lipoprotein [Stellaceae bacterium]|jgi:predicted small lipoprotein YifL|nr:lipoprotein [Stellaceae bacterium]
MSGRIAHLLVMLMVVLALAGCGKKGAPQPPSGEPDTFPRVYPSE